MKIEKFIASKESTELHVQAVTRLFLAALGLFLFHGCLFSEGSSICKDDPEDIRCIQYRGCGQICTYLDETPYCDEESKTCVACLPGFKHCSFGKICNPVTNACESGQCQQTVDCLEESTVCVNGVCLQRQCENDAGCVEGVCNPTTFQCVQCIEYEDCSQSMLDDNDSRPGFHVCDEFVNVCVKGCIISSQCPDGKLCDESRNQCVNGCSGQEDCNPGFYCEENLCLEGCDADSDCEGRDDGLTACNTQSHECVSCVERVDCPGNSVCVDDQCVECGQHTDCEANGDESKNICQIQSQICVGCLSHLDCTQPAASKCELREGENQFTCQACMEDAECVGTGLGVCNAGECAECTAARGCGPGQMCQENQCIAGPSPSCVDTGCPENEHCDEVSGACFDCLSNQHCASDLTAPLCIDRMCQGCSAENRCPSPTAALCVIEGAQAGSCAPCQADGDCLGNIGGPYCDAGECKQCLNDAQCTNPSAAKCSAENRCVPCEANISCTDPEASRCDVGTGVCQSCEANNRSQCNHIPGSPLCSAAGCVECLVADDCPAARPICVSNSCRPCREGDCPAGQACLPNGQCM